MAAFKYVWVLASIALFALLALFGQEVNGARLWIRIGPVQYEPVELIKLFIVCFMAAYLAETADVIAAAKPWSLRANARYLGPLFLGWGASMAILVAAARRRAWRRCCWRRSSRCSTSRRGAIDLIAGSVAIFAGAVVWAAHHYPYVSARIAVWRDPFADPLGRGYQAMQGLFSLASGGLFGTGYGRGHPEFIPAAATDYVFAAWSEEFGALGALVVLAAFALIVVRHVSRRPSVNPISTRSCSRPASRRRSASRSASSSAASSASLPLTGITLPFFSYGGSSLVANFLLVALAWAIGTELAPAPRAKQSRSRRVRG